MLNRRELLAGAAVLAATSGPAFSATPDLTHLGLATPAFDLKDAALNIPDLSGTIRTLEDYRGKTTLVSFWATWCPPCRKEMPTLARLSRALPSDNFTVLAVNIGDSEEKVQAFLEQIDHDGMPILMDKNSELPSKWLLRGLPVTYVLDPSGTIIYGAIGERVWDSPEIIEGLKALA